MNLYIDDDSVNRFLMRQLRQAGHDVMLPADVGLSGRKDPVHLCKAIKEQRIVLTHNYQDFEDLDTLLREAKGHHPGILIIRRDNKKKNNLRPHEAVRAIGKIIAAGFSLADQVIVLNHWR